MITQTNTVPSCPRCGNAEAFAPVSDNLIRCGRCRWMLRRDASGRLSTWLDVAAAGRKPAKPRK